MNNKYFIINIQTGSILGPCHTIEEAEQQLILVEYPKEWIVVKSVD